MYILLAILLIASSMATTQSTCPIVRKPRVVHGLGLPTIFAYPSTGGFVRKKASRVVLDWLGLTTNLSDSATTPIAARQMLASNDTSRENDFALRLMQIGGRWWPSRKFYKRHSNVGQHCAYGHHFPPDLDIGYTPSGEVLVLRTWAGNSQYLSDLPDVPPEVPDDYGRLALCATMEERCAVLRSFGTVEYGSIAECPDVPEILEEGIAEGRRYEELLKKMEDDEYLYGWLDDL